MNPDTQSRQHIINRMAQQRDFIAWHLRQYREMENLTESELIKLLECDDASFFRLALSKAPDPQKTDFISRVRNIAEYAGVNTVALTRLIRQVSNIESLRSTGGRVISMQPKAHLLAAREKNDSADTSEDNSPKS